MYRHKVVQGLADLIAKYGGGGRDPMMRAVWYGIKSQVPVILEALDNNEEAIATIEEKLREVLNIPAPIVIEEIRGTDVEVPVETSFLIPPPEPITIEEVKRVVKKAPPKRKRAIKLPPKPRPVAEVEVVVEPAREPTQTEKDTAEHWVNEFEKPAVEPAAEENNAEGD